MSVLGEFRRLSPELLEEIRALPEGVSLRLDVLDDYLELDGDGEPIARLMDMAGFPLNPITAGTPFPDERRAWGGRNGDSRSLTAEQVTEAAAMLSRTPFHALEIHLRSLLISMLEDPYVVDEERERRIRDRFAERYRELVTFFAEAAARHQCTVFWAA